MPISETALGTTRRSFGLTICGMKPILDEEVRESGHSRHLKENETSGLFYFPPQHRIFMPILLSISSLFLSFLSFLLSGAFKLTLLSGFSANVSDSEVRPFEICVLTCTQYPKSTLLNHPFYAYLFECVL